MENLDNYKDAYNENWKFFDENHWNLSMYGNLMCETVKKNNYKSVLSLGIGHSIVSDAFIGLLDSSLECYHIVEGSPEIINDFKLKHNSPKIELFNSYFENFNSNKKYDAIEMGFVLEHVDDPFIVIERFKKFLNKNGVMFIAVPNANSLHRLIGYKAGLLDDLKKLSEYDLQLGHKRYFDLASIKEIAVKAGLKINIEKGLMLKPVTGDQIKTLGWSNSVIEALLEIGKDYPDISNCIYIEASL